MSEVPLPTDETRSDNVDIVNQSLESLQVSVGTDVSLDAAQLGPFHDRVTATETYAEVNPGGFGGETTIVADTSGAATLTVGVSNDGEAWSEYTVDISGAAGVREVVSGFAYVRASVDSNLNALDVSAKGV